MITMTEQAQEMLRVEGVAFFLQEVAESLGHTAADGDFIVCGRKVEKALGEVLAEPHFVDAEARGPEAQEFYLKGVADAINALLVIASPEIVRLLDGPDGVQQYPN